MSEKRVAVRRTINRLQKWIKKREAKQLECATLHECLIHLREYEMSLLNSEWDEEVRTA